MKYADLIQFEPIETVVQLRQSEKRAEAERLVRTYVISDRMADVILHRVLPTLSLKRGEETGGLFVVGNYGTGKSHLMSLLSAVAEHADLAESVTHPAVAKGVKQVLAGQFRVVRQEFGSTNMPLRDVVLGYLQEGLKKLGVNVRFPSMDEAPNAKDLLMDAMTAFQKKYPGQGLLVVIDELLEYLLGRRERELIMDLAFLREIGETCAVSDLRFVAGIQESLFDNPRFQFAADSIRRVRDRYQQVRIVREDVAFVVSRRLLAKKDAQRKRIRTYLEKFSSLYELMAERMDEFVELFPVHPAYLEMFERVTVIEKRQALKAISQEMRRILNDDVPQDRVGLLSFDAFWRLIQEDPSYRSTPEIRDVMDKSQVLEERIRNALSPIYRDAALRIVHALSLHRLTTGDLRAPIGLTPKELRDRLCLHLPIPEADAAFLLTSVESVLQEISRAVSGQFISHNRENDQYYLDLDKDVDFDALIEQKAAVLEEDALDRYYFDALRRILELDESTYRPGFRIWQTEIPWTGRGMTRDGYVFLGARDERSHTQPERDFYIHFISLFKQNGKKDAPKSDEVFFLLTAPDDVFRQNLRLYAGAREMAAISSGSNKTQYESKANQFLNMLTRWLRENFAHAFEVKYGKVSHSVAETWGEYRLARAESSLRDQVYQLTSAILNDYFQQKYRDYPAFGRIQLTQLSLPQACQAALRALAGGPFNQQAQSILEGLELIRLREGQPTYTVTESRYASAILSRLDALGAGRVLNRKELIGVDPRRERELKFGLEPELLMVVLAALLRQGEVTLTWMGRTFTSDDLDEVARIEVSDLTHFSTIARPKPVPEQSLKALFEGVGLPVEWVGDSSQHERAAQEVSRLAETELPRLAMALDNLRDGLRYWGETILSPDESQKWRKELEGYRDLLQALERLNTPGRLRQFSLSVSEVRAKLKGRETLQRLSQMRELLQALQPHLNYVARAELRLPAGHPWQTESSRLKQEQIGWLRDPKVRSDPSLYSRLNGGLGNLRAAYMEAYLQFHQAARLDRAGDERKRSLTQDARWRQLLALQDVSILPESEFRRLQQTFNDSLRACPVLTKDDLREHTECPHCGFDPRAEHSGKPVHETLETVFQELERLHTSWVTRLREELQKPEVTKDVSLLKPPYREQIQSFIRDGKLPASVSQNFVQSVNDALQGLEKVVLNGTEFLLALTQAGMPCTVEELYQRLDALLQKQLGDKKRDKIRIEIDW
ncbi:ATP-binding protein [Chloroflexi bacterium CFX2]|nr:ATP-binding protein [Chloroflexi bacterium CFX2]